MTNPEAPERVWCPNSIPVYYDAEWHVIATMHANDKNTIEYIRSDIAEAEARAKVVQYLNMVKEAELLRSDTNSAFLLNYIDQLIEGSTK
jgi:hypothetical protein